jgi:hypothetical protein
LPVVAAAAEHILALDLVVAEVVAEFLLPQIMQLQQVQLIPL